MKCILMNKNTEVLVAEYDTGLNGFTEVYEVKDLKFAPLVIEKLYLARPNDLATDLTKWFRGRGIPSWRDQLDLLLSRLGVQTPEELLNKSFGLSLSDQYWLKPVDSDLNYSDINFFEHDFDSADFLEASFSNSSSGKLHNISLHSPNNTTDGMLRKTWIIENSERYLLKGGFRGDSLQPFNEVLASKICDRLGFPHVAYTLSEAKGKIVSKCKCLTSPNTEIIPAFQVLLGYEQGDSFSDYEEYIRVLEEAGVADAREQLENMVVLDYLITNEDRHLNNFGVIRDVESLKWLGVTPIFDNGQALNILSYGQDGIKISGEGRFFHDVVKFEDMIGAVRDSTRFDLSKLDSIADEFRDLLTSKMDKANLTKERIDALVKVLSSQIANLQAKS